MLNGQKSYLFKTQIHEFTFSKSIANFDLFIWNIPIKYKALISEECYIDICQLLCPYVQVNAVQTTGEHFPRAVSPGSGGRFLMPLRHFVAAPLLYLYTYKWLATTYTYTLYSLSIYPKKLTWPSGENLERILTVARDQPLPNILPHGNLRFSLLLLSSELLRRLLI